MRRYLLLVLGLFWCLPAFGHPLLQNSMWIVFGPDRARMAVNVSLREIMLAEQVEQQADGTFEGDKLQAAAKRHGDYLLSHFQVQAGERILSGQVASVTPPVLFAADPEQTFYQYELSYPWASPAPPASIVMSQTMLRETASLPGQPWDVTYSLRLKRADRDEVWSGLLRPNAPETFSTGWEEAATGQAMAKPTAVSHFGDYLRHGVMHILTGWDHLLFVSALVLATVTFWEMFKVIAAFTAAHTITLAASVLLGIRLPEIVVEPVIAGSIVFVAVQNLLWPQRAKGWDRLAVAFGFGLVHGLGFAGGLRDAMAELGTSAVILALVAFSVGVEIGHQVVVLPLFGALRWGDRTFPESFRAGALRYGSLAISLAGSYYLVHALRGQ